MTWYERIQVVHAKTDMPINVVIEIGEFSRGNRIYPTMFFAYFQRAPVFTVLDDLYTVPEDGLVQDIFFSNAKKKENKETPFSSA